MVAAVRERLSPRARLWLPYAFLVVIVMGIVGIHVDRYPTMSPIDELRHVDYLQRTSELHFPRLGDKLDQPALREEACRGVATTPPFEHPPCDSKRFRPEAFRDDGYQNATFHPPTYYLAGGLLSRAFVELGVFDSLVEPARLFSGLLVALGLALTLWAGRLARLRTGTVAAASLLVLAAPSVIAASVFVNPDSASILAGAAVLCAALLWERGRIPTWSLAVVGGAATAFKLTNAVAVGIVALWFLVRAIPPGWPTRLRTRFSVPESTAKPVADGEAPGYRSTLLTLGARRYVLAAVAMVAGAIAVAMVWALIDGARATIDASIIPQNAQYSADGIPNIEQFLEPRIVYAFFPPFAGFQSSFLYTDTWVQDVAQIVTYLFVGALLVQTLRFRRDDRMSIIAAVTVLVLLLGSPAFSLLQVVVNDLFNVPVARYGMSAIPAMILVVAAVVRGRTSRVILTALSCVVVGVLYLAVVF